MSDSALGNIGDAGGVLQPAVSLAQEVVSAGAGGVITNDMLGNAHQVVNAGHDGGMGAGSVTHPGQSLGSSGNASSSHDSGLL